MTRATVQLRALHCVSCWTSRICYRVTVLYQKYIFNLCEDRNYAERTAWRVLTDTFFYTDM